MKGEEIQAVLSATPTPQDVNESPALGKSQAWDGNSLVPGGMRGTDAFFRELTISNRQVNF